MYQCPNCGGGLRFDIASQKIKCDNCMGLYDPYSITKEQDAEDVTEYEVTRFVCPQCGGEILSEDNTAANFCSYCGASTILTGHLTRQKKPSYIIPFTKTKEDCKTEYLKAMKKAYFAPKELKDTRYVEEFRGIYMPYWAYHIRQNNSFALRARRDYRQGDYLIKETYDISGTIDAHYKGISHDASSTFSDNISEQIAPFDVRGMKNFTPSYLTGFYADTSDVPALTYESEAHTLAAEETFDYIKQNRGNGDLVFEVSDDALPGIFGSRTETVDSTMYPVWFLSYRKKDRVAYATVNGQTGKVCVDTPVSTGKYIIGSLLLALPIFLLMNIFFTVAPTMVLLIACLISMLTIILHSIEMKDIYVKESSQNDRGKAFKNGTDSAFFNGYGNNRKKKRLTKDWLPASLFVILFLGANLLPFAIGLFVTLYSVILALPVFIWLVICFISCIFCYKSARTIKKIKLLTTISPGYLGSLISLIISGIIFIINPASDIFYYAGSVLALLFIIITIISMISSYNILATRPLPQFTNYHGGDDRAY